MKKAFTLIELLIVVAIIAILAAIAVPNFLEAQTRAKVSRAKADLRTVATGLEAYAVDWNKYPFCEATSASNAYFAVNVTLPAPQNNLLERITTPVAYLTNILIPDPFKPKEKRASFSPGNTQGTPAGAAGWADEFIKYAAFSQGDGMVNYARAIAGVSAKTYVTFVGSPMRYWPALGSLMRDAGAAPEVVSAQFYDPTNGSVSYGAIFRVGGQSAPALDTSLDYYGGEFTKQAFIANK